MNRRLLIALLAACALLMVACGDDGGNGDENGSADASGDSSTTTTTEAMDEEAPDDAAAATISGLTFQPDPIEVSVGTTVEWTNEDGVGHTVTAEDGTFDEEVDAGGGASVTFDEAGEYKYFCGIHSEMNGTVVVS